MTTPFLRHKAIHAIGESTNPVYVSIPFQPFVETITVSDIDPFLHKLGIFVPTFVVEDTLTIHPLQFISDISFVESEYFYVGQVAETFKKTWVFENQILLGRSWVFSVPLGFQNNFIMRNKLSEGLRGDVSLRNVLSESSVGPGWSVGNELTATESVIADWSFRNSIGVGDTDGRTEFWNQGPVVHRTGSHGGYE